MRRPHTLTLFVLSILLTLATFFVPPLFPEGKGLEKGFPFPWANQTDIPGNNLPFIGPLISMFETSTLSLNWQYFLVDVAIFTAILFTIFYSLGRRVNNGQA